MRVTNLFVNTIKQWSAINWEPTRGKAPFVRALPEGARVLDVGCGNNSPEWFKTVRPDLYYVGIDVADYNQVNNPAQFADEYITTCPTNFAREIYKFRGEMDAVISCHNIEHCDDPGSVLNNMICALKPNGKLYLSFPSEASVSFPHRQGCLNFFDDSSHKQVPNWSLIINAIEHSGCKIYFMAKRYRPFPLWFRGLLREPLSAIRRKVETDGSTWALYGFESVVWASAHLTDIEINEWGPKETTKDQGVNLQPDGASAIWIQASGVDGFGHVGLEFNGYRSEGPTVVKNGLLTAAIPKKVISLPGRYDVVITEFFGRRTKVGVFVVND